MKKIKNYFIKFELCLWCLSVCLITVSFFAFNGESYLKFIASLIGVTFILFNAKGNPIGQFLTIVFSVLYGIISYSFAYYGEMITYLGISAPIALFALISWLKNPYQGNHSEVKVNRLKKKEIIFMLILTVVVTIAFYFILSAFNTANIMPSTISVTTSFLGAYLTFRRSPYFSLAYASNDVVLIILWVLASIIDRQYISMVACFSVFLINNIYGFVNWRKMEKSKKHQIKCLFIKYYVI